MATDDCVTDADFVGCASHASRTRRGFERTQRVEWRHAAPILGKDFGCTRRHSTLGHLGLTSDELAGVVILMHHCVFINAIPRKQGFCRVR